jgi:deoxycytidylate deaminase
LRDHHPCDKVRVVLIAGAVSRVVGEKLPREQEEQHGDQIVSISTVTRRRFPLDCVGIFEGIQILSGSVSGLQCFRQTIVMVLERVEAF